MRIVLTSVFFTFNVLVFAQKTYLYCGRLIDTRAGIVQSEMTIIIEKNKIIYVVKGYSPVGVGDKKIDLKS